MSEADTPLVSVVLTSYNYAKYLTRAINSVINQSYSHWELIIVDDGSQDNSLMIITDFVKSNEKIKLFTHPNSENKGLKATLGLGISQANGKYLAFLESDDFWDSDYLKRKVEVLEKHPDVSLVYSDINLIFENGLARVNKYVDYLNYSRFIGYKFKGKPFDVKDVVLYVNPVVSFSNIVGRTEIIKKCNLTSEFELWNDWWLTVFLSLFGEFYYVGEKLLNWRIHQESANYKLTENVDTHFQGKLFKIELLKYIKDVLAREGRIEELKQFVNIYFSNFSFVKFFIHSFKFFLHHPLSVIRTFLFSR